MNMKKNLKENSYMYIIPLIGLLIIIIDKYYAKISNILFNIIFIIIICLCFVYAFNNIIIKSIIRKNKLKKVSKSDLKKLDEFCEYNFDQELLKRNNINEYIIFLKYLSKNFKKMNKKIMYTKIDMDMEYRDLMLIKNKTIKEYLVKIKEVNEIIFKYYDESGNRKI